MTPATARIATLAALALSAPAYAAADPCGPTTVSAPERVVTKRPARKASVHKHRHVDHAIRHKPAPVIDAHPLEVRIVRYVERACPQPGKPFRPDRPALAFFAPLMLPGQSNMVGTAWWPTSYAAGGSSGAGAFAAFGGSGGFGFGGGSLGDISLPPLAGSTVTPAVGTPPTGTAAVAPPQGAAPVPAQFSFPQPSLFSAAAPGSVPEPATWAMMIVGVGFVGAALRRRERMMV